MNEGWELEGLSRNDFYSSGQRQLFSVSGGAFFREYLLALLQADALFKKGLRKIYHAQSKSYYQALMALCCSGSDQSHLLGDLEPNKPAAVYKRVLRNIKEGKGKKVQPQPQQPQFHGPMGTMEDDCSFLTRDEATASVKSAFAAGSKEGRGRGRGRAIKREPVSNTGAEAGAKRPRKQQFASEMGAEEDVDSAEASSVSQPDLGNEDSDADSFDQYGFDVSGEAEHGVLQQFQNLASTLAAKTTKAKAKTTTTKAKAAKKTPLSAPVPAEQTLQIQDQKRTMSTSQPQLRIQSGPPLPKVAPALAPSLPMSKKPKTNSLENLETMRKVKVETSETMGKAKVDDHPVILVVDDDIDTGTTSAGASEGAVHAAKWTGSSPSRLEHPNTDVLAGAAEQVAPAPAPTRVENPDLAAHATVPSASSDRTLGMEPMTSGSLTPPIPEVAAVAATSASAEGLPASASASTSPAPDPTDCPADAPSAAASPAPKVRAEPMRPPTVSRPRSISSRVPAMTSMYARSTVWIGDIPIIKRADKGVVTWCIGWTCLVVNLWIV